MARLLSLFTSILVLCAISAIAQTDYVAEGNNYLNQRQYERAIESYTKAIQQYPKMAAAYYNRALAYVMTKRADLALADLEVVLQIDPKNTDALIQRSYIYGDRDQYTQALADLNRALSFDTLNATVYFNRAQTYSRQKMMDEAMADYNRAIMLRPDVQAYIGRATAHLSTDRANLALEDLQRAIQIDSMNALAWLSRGEAYMAMDASDSAMWAWRRSLALDPQGQYASYINDQLVTMSADAMGLRDSVFMDNARQIAVTLPKSWHAVSSDDGSTVVMRIARQPIRSATEPYAEGMTIKYYRKASQFVTTKNPTPQQIVTSWAASNAAAAKSLPGYTVIRVEPIVTTSGWTGELREIVLQPAVEGYRIHQYEALLARPDELITITGEVAQPLWPAYNSRLLSAIRTIQLPVKGY